MKSDRPGYLIAEGYEILDMSLELVEVVRQDTSLDLAVLEAAGRMLGSVLEVPEAAVQGEWRLLDFAGTQMFQSLEDDHRWTRVFGCMDQKEVSDFEEAVEPQGLRYWMVAGRKQFATGQAEVRVLRRKMETDRYEGVAALALGYEMDLLVQEDNSSRDWVGFVLDIGHKAAVADHTDVDHTAADLGARIPAEAALTGPATSRNPFLL